MNMLETPLEISTVKTKDLPSWFSKIFVLVPNDIKSFFKDRTVIACLIQLTANLMRVRSKKHRKRQRRLSKRYL